MLTIWMLRQRRIGESRGHSKGVAGYLAWSSRGAYEALGMISTAGLGCFGRLMMQRSTYSVAMTHKKIWVDSTEYYLLHRLVLHPPASPQPLRVSGLSPAGPAPMHSPTRCGVGELIQLPSVRGSVRNGVQERRGIEGLGIV